MLAGSGSGGRDVLTFSGVKNHGKNHNVSGESAEASARSEEPLQLISSDLGGQGPPPSGSDSLQFPHQTLGQKSCSSLDVEGDE